MISDSYQKMGLKFNEYGQVVDHNLDKFDNIIGAMVQEHVPVVFKDWHSVDGKKFGILYKYIS